MQELAQEKNVRIKSALWQDRKMVQGQSVLGQDKKIEQTITQEFAQDKEPPPPPPTTSIEASSQSSVANTRRRVSVLAPVEQESSLRIPDTKKAPLRVVLPTIEFSFRQSLYDTTTPTTISSSKEDLSSSLAPSKGPAPPQPTYNERRKVSFQPIFSQQR
jgi:hypothetical protein